MTLSPGDGTETAIEVATLPEVSNGLVNVELVQAAEERERVDGAVEEACIDLAPLVPCEHTRGLL